MKTVIVPASLLLLAASSHLSAEPANSKVIDYEFAKIRVRYQPGWPPYPADWPPLKSRAIVVLSITIDEEGKPILVTGIDGPVEARRYAVLHLSNWLFHPVVINNQAQRVRFKMTVPVEAKKPQ